MYDLVDFPEHICHLLLSFDKLFERILGSVVDYIGCGDETLRIESCGQKWFCVHSGSGKKQAERGKASANSEEGKIQSDNDVDLKSGNVSTQSAEANGGVLGCTRKYYTLKSLYFSFEVLFWTQANQVC